NAIVATDIPASNWARHFDSVSVCFSKGLGAPVGSALAGSKKLIAKALRVRKLLGGGMRQAGILASGCLYALDHHVERLAEDHRDAQVIAEAMFDTPGLEPYPPRIETNLVWCRVDPDLGTAEQIVARLEERGIRIFALGPQTIRACTHLDVSGAQAERAAETIRKTLRRMPALPNK